MTGLDLAKAIRKQRPEISVVLMTGDENEATRRAAKLAGAFTCLTKPFRTEALVEVLRAPASVLRRGTIGEIVK
jgi:CheY-like chemotaxis protein